MLLQCPHVSRGQLALWVEDRGVLWFSMGICLGFQFCMCVLNLKFPALPTFASERVTQRGREDWTTEFCLISSLGLGALVL